MRIQTFGILIAFLLMGCGSSYATPTRALPTLTKIRLTKTIIPTKTPLPQVSIGIVEVQSLNIRSGPGTSFGVIDSLKQGDEFYILADVNNSENQQWLLIPLADNSFGWVIGESKYVTQKWKRVDYSTYTMLLDSARLAKLIYDTTPTVAFSRPVIPTANLQYIPSAACTCSSNSYNCGDFSTQREAQSCFNHCLVTVGYDVHWLDEDSDGSACEWNP